MDKVKKYALWFFKSFIWLGLLLLVIDIVTKNVVVNNMEVGESIPLIKGFLHITYTVNTAAAFGLGTDNVLANRIVYIVMASIATAALIFVYVKFFKRLGKMYKACIMLMVVGALGNLIDRIFYTPDYLKYTYTGVVDWIDFCGIWKYIFNIADSAIVIGTIMLIIWLIIEEVQDSKKRNEVVLKKDVVEAKIAASKVENEKEEETPLEIKVEKKKPEPKRNKPEPKTANKSSK